MSKSYMNIICGHQTGKVVWNVHMCFNKVKVNKKKKKKKKKKHTHTHTHTHTMRNQVRMFSYAQCKPCSSYG